MVNKEVLPAFDILLEEEKTIKHKLNKLGARLLEARCYPEVQWIEV